MECSSDDSAAVNFSKVIPCKTKGTTVIYAITIKNDDSWELPVLGKKLNASKYTALKSYLPTISKESIVGLITTLNELHLCPGMLL